MENDTSASRPVGIFTRKNQRFVGVLTLISFPLISMLGQYDNTTWIVFVLMFASIAFQAVATVRNYEGKFSARYKIVVLVLVLTVAMAVWQYAHY